MGLLKIIYVIYALWAYSQRNNMPYGPTRKEITCLMGLLAKKLYALWAYSQRNNMPYGPTCKENHMPYGPTHKEICLMGLLAKKYALWAYLQRNNMPYGPTYKEIIFCCPMSLCM